MKRPLPPRPPREEKAPDFLLHSLLTLCVNQINGDHNRCQRLSWLSFLYLHEKVHSLSATPLPFSPLICVVNTYSLTHLIPHRLHANYEDKSFLISIKAWENEFSSHDFHCVKCLLSNPCLQPSKPLSSLRMVKESSFSQKRTLSDCQHSFQVYQVL